MEAEQWCLVRQEELDMIRRKDILGKQQLGRVKSIVLRLSVHLSVTTVLLERSPWNIWNAVDTAWHICKCNLC